MKQITAFFSRVLHILTSLGGYAKRHKLQAGIAVVAIIGASWWGYTAWAASVTTTQYTLAAAADGAIAVTVTGSGVISAEHTLTLSPKASGTLTSVLVKPGQTVSAGQIIATIDSTDAQKTVRDAQTNLQSARISYKTSITSANDSVTSSKDSVTSARDAGFDAVANVEPDLPPMLSEMKTVVETNRLDAFASVVRGIDPSIDSALQKATVSYRSAVIAYDDAVSHYQVANRTSSPEDIAALLDSTYTSMVSISQAVKDILAFMTQVNTDIIRHNDLNAPTDLATEITAFTGYTATANSDTSSLRSASSNLRSAIQTLAQNTQSISGSTPLSIESAQIALQKAQNTYDDAVSTLANYVVRAPFAGTIATVSLQKYDQASASASVATLITNQTYASLSMNETDAAKVQAGQAASITFDAIDDLTVNGTVAEISGIGTVSQGVTTYDVKIGLDTQDARVKPGMTVEATITAASKENALLVPASAVKSTKVNGQTSYYVQVATVSGSELPNPYAQRTGTSTATTTRVTTGTQEASSTSAATRTSRTTTVDASKVTITRVPVTLGLQNDTQTEILSGLTPGQLVVTASLNTKGKSTTQGGSILGLLGGNRTAGAAARTTGTTGTTRTTGGAAVGAARPSN